MKDIDINNNNISLPLNHLNVIIDGANIYFIKS